LLASLTGIVGGCILGFIILKTGPILTDVAENDIAVSDLEKRVDTLDTRLSVAEATILINTERNDTQFVMLAKRRSSVIEELRRENTALKEAIVENTRGLR
jgi:chaperonin cofactor prefoldin